MDGAAAFASSRKKYHVFISFRGEDTRRTFTCHLYHAFGLQKINAYIDEESLEKGDEITPSLLEAIADSEISVVILSKNYASSRWCLEELDQILQCKERNNQIVIPVFYEVDPSDVRKQQHSYASALAAHEIRFKDQMDKLQQWRNSLKTVADLSGFNSSDFGSDSKLVETVVEDIKEKLQRILMLPSIDFKDLVGIQKRIQDVESILNTDSSDISIVGIWGMGGMGKTTLAKAVFNKFAFQFDSYCFLDNVREAFKSGRLHKLQKKLFSEILLSEEKSFYKISPFEQDRFCRTKVLLVLDDVNDIDQWEKLVGEIRGWFGSGSKIIVTSREKQVFNNIEDVELYEIGELNFDESLHLFCLKAFQQSSPTTDYVDLSQRVVSYAGGLPLALIVLGSHLNSKSTNEWKSALDKLKTDGDDKIHKVLEMSYDGLDENGKQIFLDIAFFFKGAKRDYVTQMLSGFGCYAEIGIRNLIDRSIITVKNNNIWMHDLLQQMGHRIVKAESQNNLGRRSRLSSTDDILKVLKYNIGTEAIQGISLATCQLEDVLHLKPGVFKKMYNLKYLKLSIYNGENCLNFPERLKSLPDELRYLSWNYYPLNSLPTKFNPQNLIELNLSDSKLEHLWNGFQNLANLKLLNLSYSKKLIQIPDLSQALKLEEIDLRNCTCLENLPSNISKLESLQSLNLSHCPNFKEFPKLPLNIKYLYMEKTSIEQVQIPDLSRALKLEVIDLSNCPRLENLPSNISKLESLRSLDLSHCPNINKFPELPVNIELLYMEKTSIEQVPSSIGHLFHLRSLLLDGCSRLEYLPEISKHLTRLVIQQTGIRRLPSSIENLVKFKRLELSECKNLEFIPDNIYNMQLEEIDLSGCSKLESLPHPLSVGLLFWKRVNLDRTNVFEIPDWLFRLPVLHELSLCETGIRTIPTSIKHSKLRELYIRDCKSLEYLPELPISIKLVDARRCTSLLMILNASIDTRSISISKTLTAFEEEPWSYDSYYRQKLIFENCLKLDCNNIIFEFQIRALCLNFLPRPKEVKFPGSNYIDRRSIYIYFPGDDIPKWFNYQNDNGSSINIKLLPPQCYDKTNFMGFASCVVVAPELIPKNPNSEVHEHYFKLKCDVNVQTNNGQTCYTLESTLCELTMDSSNHVLMCYFHTNEIDVVSAKEISFVFRAINQRDKANPFTYKVERCGIHMLQVQDAVDFGINITEYVHWKHNIITHEHEPSIHRFANFKTNEPPPKRTKFSSSP